MTCGMEKSKQKQKRNKFYQNFLNIYENKELWVESEGVGFFVFSQ